MSYILASPASAGVTGTLELDYIASMGPILIHQIVVSLSGDSTTTPNITLFDDLTGATFFMTHLAKGTGAQQLVFNPAMAIRPEGGAIFLTVSDVSAGVTAIVWALYGQGGERI